MSDDSSLLECVCKSDSHVCTLTDWQCNQWKYLIMLEMIFEITLENLMMLFFALWILYKDDNDVQTDQYS